MNSRNTEENVGRHKEAGLWFYAKRGSITQRGKTDVKGIKAAIKSNTIGPHDLMLPPGENEQWQTVESMALFKHALKQATRKRRRATRIAWLILTTAGIGCGIGLTIMEYLEPADTAPPPTRASFASISDEVAALAAIGDFEEAWSAFDAGAALLTTNTVEMTALSNQVVQAETVPLIRRSIEQGNTEKAEAYLTTLRKSDLSKKQLNDFEQRIKSIKSRRADVIRP